MKYSQIQDIMIKKIIDGSVSLCDFYDSIFSFELIEDELEERLGKEFNKIKHQIDPMDIIKVAGHLIKQKKLTDDEINDFILYINDNYKPDLMQDQDFVNVYDIVCQYLNSEISSIDKQIKNFKNQDKIKDNIASLDNRRTLAIDSKNRINANRRFIEISLNELEKIKLNLPIVPIKQKKSKKEKILIKHLKIKGKSVAVEKPVVIDSEAMKIHQTLKKLSILIDSDKVSDVEITTFVFENISSIEKKDLHYIIKEDINEVTDKLKERLKINKLNKERVNNEISNIDELKDEYSNMNVIDEKECEQYRERKKMLKSSVGLLESLKEDIDLSPKELKAALLHGRQNVQYEKKYLALDSVKDLVERKGSLDVDTTDEGRMYRLGLFSEQLPAILEGYGMMAFNNYKPNGTVYDAFYLNGGNGKPIKHNYAFSIERRDNETIVRMHVLNIYPYVNSSIVGFWTDNFYRQFSKDLEPDSESLKYLNEGFKFKLDQVYPTIAYKFSYDNNYRLTNFDIEAKDIKMKLISLNESTIMHNIYSMNNKDNKFKRQYMYYENTLKDEFIKYASSNNLPVIYFGRYNDQSRGIYNKGKIIGKDKMAEKMEVLEGLLKDYDGSTFYNVCWRYFKNYRLKHFSLEYNNDFNYSMADLGIINPASFMGNNLQKVINSTVFEYNNGHKSLIDEQGKIVKTSNNACGYIELDDFIDMVEQTISENKTKRF